MTTDPTTLPAPSMGETPSNAGYPSAPNADVSVAGWSIRGNRDLESIVAA